MVLILVSYLRENANPRDGNTDDATQIRGELMAHYLLSLFGQLGQGRGGPNPFMGPLGMFGPGGEGLGEGRYGDYVFTQDGNYDITVRTHDTYSQGTALDQIISQIMEASNSHRPVPASEDVVENLPRAVLEQGGESSRVP